MKTIIAGTRTAATIDLTNAMMACPFRDEISEVVSGDCRGADRLGESWASRSNLHVTKFPPDWTTYGNAAGPIRNQQMADYADTLILVWDGKSRGSADMLKKAKAAGLRVFVWDYVRGEAVPA